MNDIALKVSLIVPTKNRADMLQRFLPSLVEQSTDELYEIIVVDNASTDDTSQVVSRLATGWPYLRSIREEKPGSASACHAGAVAARAPIILFVDDDMKAVPELVREHLAAHKANPGSCVLGQILSAPGERPFDRMLAYIYDGPRLSLGERQPDASDYWSGNVSMPREIYFRLGGYNQVFATLGYGKDVDFGKRLVENGVPLVFAERALTFQHFDELFKDRIRKSYRCGVTYGYVRDNYPDLPIPEGVTPDIGLKDQLTEIACRVAATCIEPFDRGEGRPVTPLAYVYDLGLRIAARRGLRDYLAGKAKVKLPN